MNVESTPVDSTVILRVFLHDENYCQGYPKIDLSQSEYKNVYTLIEGG